jgi:hypothetical protein
MYKAQYLPPQTFKLNIIQIQTSSLMKQVRIESLDVLPSSSTGVLYCYPRVYTCTIHKSYKYTSSLNRYIRQIFKWARHGLSGPFKIQKSRRYRSGDVPSPGVKRCDFGRKRNLLRQAYTSSSASNSTCTYLHLIPS